ncbi:MAG TPA: type II toxin-antitoxin system VapC family toxin [Thiothrix sp.]|nr:type II toxin-antitoxin system VapC family toxin [Thiothrix sp.]
MIAIDTNIVVRLLTEDDQKQFQKSLALFENNDIFIPDTVILETEWVLRYAYDFDAETIREGLKKLFGLPNVQLDNPVLIAQALVWHSEGLDFADALHLAKSQRLSHLYTFDKQFIKKSNNLSYCSVTSP